jgi:3,4-dihydroxy 2-butanone 4-phosphate synthase / GTP cyclohydrolase II
MTIVEEVRIERIGEFKRPTPLGDFDVVCYQLPTGTTGFALSRGDVPADGLLVRVQSPCLFGESFLVNSCDCAAQMHQSIEVGIEADNFLMVYLLDQEGRGHGMVQKIKAVQIEANDGVDMPEAFRILDLPLERREWATAAAVIRDINGDRPIRLMTNNPKKVNGLEEQGITVSDRVPVLVDPPNEPCRRYLASKKREMGHILPNIEV